MTERWPARPAKPRINVTGNPEADEDAAERAIEAYEDEMSALADEYYDRF